MSDIVKILGQRIRNYRTSKGLSQEKLAEHAVVILPTSVKSSVAKRTLQLKV